MPRSDIRPLVALAIRAYESELLSDTPDPPRANRYRMHMAISAVLAAMAEAEEDDDVPIVEDIGDSFEF
jgi:hypothetical protein